MADSIQKAVFVNLINYYLKPQNIQITELKDLIRDNSFPMLVQALAGENENIGKWIPVPDHLIGKPMGIAKINNNFGIVLNYLSRKNPSFKNISQPKEENDLIILIFKIFNEFIIVQTKLSLVKIINQNLKDVDSSVCIKNMGNSWVNGLPFIALLSKASNGKVENVDKGDPEANFNYIKKSCEDLTIPFVLTKECISNPNEDCNCIQSALILKSMNALETKPDNTKPDNAKKKFEEKILEYRKIVHEALDILENELNQIEKISKCCSDNDIQTKRNYIHKINGLYINNRPSFFPKVIESWSVLENHMKRSSDIQIPSDLIKIEDIEKKLNQLKELVSKQNLENDENIVHKYKEEIKNINNLTSARKEFNELKEIYDMENWEHFNHNTFVYALGLKLQNYENELKEAINKYEELLNDFENLHNDIIKQIEAKSNEFDGANESTLIHDYIINQIKDNLKKINVLKDLISLLNPKLEKVKQSFDVIKILDPSDQTNFDEEHFKSEINLVNKLYDEYKNQKNHENNVREQYYNYYNKYMIESKAAINMYEENENHLNELKKVYSLADFDNLKNYINKFNDSDAKMFNDKFNEIQNLWTKIDEYSKITTLPIPNDIIKIEDIQHNLNNLEEMIKIQKDKLENIENDIKQLNDKIDNINNLTCARKEFNELKEIYDMEHWKRFKNDSVVYKLGYKLQNYENEIKETINKYEELSNDFENMHNDIMKQIEAKADIYSLKELMSSYDHILNKIGVVINDIKEKDPIIKDNYSYEEFQSQIESDTKIFEEYKQKVLRNKFEIEADMITSQLNKISEEINKYPEYHNLYSTNICSKAQDEHPISFPICKKLEELLEQIGDDSEIREKMNEIRKNIENNTNEFTKQNEILKLREKKCNEIESSALDAKSECIKLKDSSLKYIIDIYYSAEKKIKYAESLKKWDENEKGPTIDKYNDSMKIAYEIFNDGLRNIENKMNSKMNEVRSYIENNKNNDITDETIKSKSKSIYDNRLYSIEKNIIDSQDLLMVDEKMNYNKKKEIEGFLNDLDQMKEQLNSVKDRILEYINEKKDDIIKMINEQSKQYNDELTLDNARIDELSASYFNQKSNEIISKYIEFCESNDLIKKLNYDFKFNIEIPEINDHFGFLHDLIIIYKSTYLLSPKKTIPNFMSIVYYIEFAKENNRFNIEKTSKESILQEFKNNEFNKKILFQILDLIDNFNSVQQNEVQLFIFSNYLHQMLDFLKWMDDYMFTYIEKDYLIDQRNKFRYCKMKPIQLIQIFDNVITKLNSKKDIKTDYNNNYKINEGDGILIDCGSSKTRIGIIGDEEPLLRFPTKVASINNDHKPGKLWVSPLPEVTNKKNECYYYGDELSEEKRYNVYYPVKNGSIDIEYWILYIRYLLLKKLKIDPKKHDLLISFPYFFFEKKNKNLHLQILEFFFDELKFGSICIVDSSILSLYANAKYTGFSVDIGYENTRFCPVYDSHVIPYYSSNINLGGNDISIALKEQLKDYNINDNIIEDIKKNFCVVAYDEDDKSDISQRPYTLPDGREITLSTERFSCFETLVKNISQKIFDSIEQIDKDFQQDFYSNIIISGGSSSLPGIEHRIEMELKKLTKNKKKIKVIASTYNEDSVWLGGSILGSMAFFNQMVVKKDEYDQINIQVFRKFI